MVDASDGASVNIPAGIAADEFIEDLQCAGLKIIARRGGFRYGTDSVLLANYVKANRGDNIVELCSGTGAVSILLSAKTQARLITGIEIQKGAVDSASRSAALNAITDRVRFIHGDIREIRRLADICTAAGAGESAACTVTGESAGTCKGAYTHERKHLPITVGHGNPTLQYTPYNLRQCFRPLVYIGAGAADVVAVNPPYLRAGSGRPNSDTDAAIARHELSCTLSDVTAAAKWLLRPGGRFYAIYRPDRLVDLFCAMRESSIEPKELQPVCASASKPPSFVLVSGKKNAATGLILRQPMAAPDIINGRRP